MQSTLTNARLLHYEREYFIMTIKSLVEQSLKANKAKAKKPSKVVRVLQFNDALKTFTRASVTAVGALVKREKEGLQVQAKKLDKILRNVGFDDFTKYQSTVWKPDYMEVNNATDDNATKAWARVYFYMEVKKPKSTSKDAQRVALARGAKPKIAGSAKDNRVTPLSVKLQELKTMALKRDIYSVKAMGHLNFAIKAFEVCEAEAIADKKVKAKAKPKAKPVAKV